MFQSEDENEERAPHHRHTQTAAASGDNTQAEEEQIPNQAQDLDNSRSEESDVGEPLVRLGKHHPFCYCPRCLTIPSLDGMDSVSESDSEHDLVVNAFVAPTQPITATVGVQPQVHKDGNQGGQVDISAGANANNGKPSILELASNLDEDLLVDVQKSPVSKAAAEAKTNGEEQVAGTLTFIDVGKLFRVLGSTCDLLLTPTGSSNATVRGRKRARTSTPTRDVASRYPPLHCVQVTGPRSGQSLGNVVGLDPPPSASGSTEERKIARPSAYWRKRTAARLALYNTASSTSESSDDEIVLSPIRDSGPVDGEVNFRNNRENYFGATSPEDSPEPGPRDHHDMECTSDALSCSSEEAIDYGDFDDIRVLVNDGSDDWLDRAMEDPITGWIGATPPKSRKPNDYIAKERVS